MKYFVSLLFLMLFFSSCFLFFDKEKLIQKKILNDDIVIELYYQGGGATDSDIIWIKKIEDGKTTWVGKIKGFTDSDKEIIKQIDNHHISINFVNEKDFQDKPIIFLIDLRSKIKRSGESPFNKPE